MKINESELDNLRYERKFLVSEFELQEIEHIIKSNPAMFSEIFYERYVNNIYFDSYDFKNYRENIYGNSQRIKIRIRWYGKMFGLIKKPVLELKMKNNGLGKKQSFILKPFILDKNFSADVLHKVFLDSNLPKDLIEELKLCHPTLLNSYKRRYFVSKDKRYRLTIDWDLVFLRINKKNNNFNEKIIDRETKVLEMKYSLKDCEDEHFISNYFPFRIIANSKYIKGIDLLNL